MCIFYIQEMKLAFISDIHSNIHALNSVIDKIDSLDVEKVFCCGDIVGYYAFPKDCIDLIKKRDIFSVMGNHDMAVVEDKSSWFADDGVFGIKYSRKNLSSDDIKLLAGLPYNALFDFDGISFYIAHGSPRDNLFEYVHPHFSDEKLLEIGSKASADVIILGHTHVQMEAEVDHKLFLNPGSVGQPRDGISKSCFMVFDTKDSSRNWYRVSYDIESASKAVIESGLPRSLSDKLYNGGSK